MTVLLKANLHGVTAMNLISKIGKPVRLVHLRLITVSSSPMVHGMILLVLRRNNLSAKRAINLMAAVPSGVARIG